MLQKFRFLLLLGLALLGMSRWGPGPTSFAADNAETCCRIAVPAYFAPNTPYWQLLMNGAPIVGLAVINPNNGPGEAADSAYQDLVRRVQAEGIRVIGYVYTKYGNRNSDEVQTDIRRHFEWYGVDGIFLDEASTDCEKLDYYQALAHFIRSFGSDKTVVLNPGTNTQECYAQVGDILLVFEGDKDAYENWSQAEWTLSYPKRRFWHLIYDVQEEALRDVVERFRNHRAGWVYVTSDGMDNPWDTLPDYWYKELEALGPWRVFLPLVVRQGARP